MPIVVIPNNFSLYQTLTVVADTSYPDAPEVGVTYISKGERWDTIAYKMYSDATQITPIIQNNSGVAIGDYVPSGTKLFIPLITVAVTTQTTTPWG